MISCSLPPQSWSVFATPGLVCLLGWFFFNFFSLRWAMQALAWRTGYHFRARIFDRINSVSHWQTPPSVAEQRCSSWSRRLGRGSPATHFAQLWWVGMLCTLAFDQGRNVLTPLLVTHLVAEVLILLPRWGEGNNWLSSPRGIFGGEFPGLCYIPKETEGRAACLASERRKACAAATPVFSLLVLALFQLGTPKARLCRHPAAGRHAALSSSPWRAGWPAVLGGNFPRLLRS